MPLVVGTRLGPYEILGPLGAGGMGEVYRARDARLGREVAVKILPASVANDADRLRRFEVEARAAGQLNHPNILTVHDTGFADGWSYLVSELLDGETLRARLARGRLSIEAAIDFSLQIARGLQAAHAKRIVHRDLKPENVFVTPDGRIKILDFGLAKLTHPAAHDSAADTVGVQQTEPGVVMGTAGYMSPEQVRGEAIDHTSDLFAFGAILYEMVCGAPAFPGESSVEIMSAVLRREVPDATVSNTALPPGLGRIVRRCLEKSPSARFQSAADLAFAIETVSSSPSSSPAVSATDRARRSPIRAGHLGWVAAIVLALVTMWLASAQVGRDTSVQRLISASILPPENSIFGAFVVSPDGRWLAFTDTSTTGKGKLWIRALEGPVVTQALAGTTGALNPFWSPDGRSLGFFADSQLKVIDIAGGSPRPLAEVIDNRGGTWNRDNVIVFGRDKAGPLYRVSASGGGAAIALTQLGKNEGTHRWPQFLPDGKHLLYFVRSTDEQLVGTYVASLDNPAGRLVLATATNAVYAPQGYLLHVQDDGALFAERFDATTLTTTGKPSLLLNKVGLFIALNRSTLSVSNNGVMVYGASEDRLAAWFDRNGQPQGTIASAPTFSSIQLGPDDMRGIGERPNPRTGANDIVLLDLSRGALQTRFTTNPASDSRAMWMPGSNLIVYASNRTGAYDLYSKPASGAGDEALLYSSPESKYPTSGSPDGRILFFEREGPNARTSLWTLSMADKKVLPLLESGFNEAQARMSPDGHWIAYVSDRDESSEVYVVDAVGALSADAGVRRSAAAAGRRVSSTGGTQPVWRRDGRKSELYYLAPDRRLMAVSFGDDARPAEPISLFETRIADAGHAYQNFAASVDGQRFLMLVRAEESTGATIVLSWTSLLK